MKLLAVRTRFLLGALLFATSFAYSQTTAVTSLAPAGPYCAGASVSVNFSVTGVFVPGNNFTAQLSSSTGSFAAPVNIGTLNNTITGGTISATIPITATSGAGYKIQVVGSTPAGVPTASAAFTITGLGMTAPTGVGTQCAGATFNITNNLTNACGFGAGNTFTVQLSNSAGSFSSTTNIGSISSTTGGTISVTLPSNATTSANYAIQIVSSNPALTSPASAAFTINAFGMNAPTGVGTQCAGATFNVTNNLANACSFGAGNTFTVQLSSSTGSFASPTNIGSISSTTGGAISVTLPITATGSANYRVQVVSSNPALTSTQSAVFQINAVGLAAPTGMATRCAGATFNVTNNLINACAFGAGNTFTVELSNSAGSFSSPTNIGLLSSTAGGAISVTLPLTLTSSANYAVQIVSSNPAITSPTSAAFQVNALGLNAPTVLASYCQGTTFNITNNLSNACAFGTGNTFTVQLSDQFGSFTSSTTIGSSAATTGGAISVTIPQTQTQGTSYQMRVVSSNPAVTSPATTNITINSPGFNTPTGVGTQCAGATFNVTNNLTTCSFFAGNTFTVQLSDASGNFGSPVTIGTTTSVTGGAISVTLPSTTTTSSNYKVQIISTNPALTSSGSAAFTINGFGLNAPTIVGGATAFCQGQAVSITYTLANGCAFPNTPASNVFSAQLSDASGSFASPTVIGTITSNTGGTISANIGNPAAGTSYRIRVVSSNPGSGVASADNGTNLTIQASFGNPATFPTGGWNAYVYNSTTIAGFANYNGFYSFSGLSFNTSTQFGTTSSPSLASGYSGCSVVGNVNYGITFKQTGFTCGYYQLDVPYQDDQCVIYVNGTQVFSNLAFTSTAQTNVWQGFLGASSTVEIRFVNLGSAGQLQINLATIANSLTLSPNLVQCSSPTTPGTLSASSAVPLTYTWSPAAGLSSTSGPSVTASPSITTIYTATGTDGPSGTNTGCTVTGNITVTVSNATPTVTASAVPATICSGVVTSTLTASGASNYVWTPNGAGSGLTPSTGIGSTVTANPTTTTTYTVTGNNGCTGAGSNGTASVAVTVQNIPASPPTTTYGSGTWNVYCNYNNTTFSNYYGYYTENNLSFNTSTRWGTNAGPAVANASSGLAYSGCSFPNNTGTCGANTLASTDYSMSFKRTNFTCGYYQLDVNYQDDQFTLLVNGVQVFQNTAFTSALQSNVWTGFLGPTSKVEMRLINSCGPGQLQVTFSASTGSPQTISPDVTICAGTTTNLTATAVSYPNATYTWAINTADPSFSFSPGTNVANTILQTTGATPAGGYVLTSTLTDAGAGGTGCSAKATNTLTVNPLPSTAVTPTAISTYCPSAGIILKASGANTYIWNPSTDLSASTGYQVTATPTVTTTYQVTGSNNCATNSASTTITVLPLPAITTFPTGMWNVYGFNSNTIGTNYEGFYTENGSGTSGYDFNTTTRWVSGAAPSTANATNGTAWQGCAMNATTISLSFKRTGFTCGIYQINVPYHDDDFYLIINGVTVAKHVGCCDAHTAIWTGVLGSTSQVEFQLIQGGGGSSLNATFTPVSTPASTNTWLGGTSTDWFTASNWCSAVPTTTTDAYVPASSQQFMPAIAATGANVRNITIDPAVAAGTYTLAIAAASLTTSGTNNLNVYGNWTANGTYTANSGSITFTGSSGNTINATGTTAFSNLIINDAAGVTIASGTQQVSGTMTFTSGIVTQNSTLNILSSGAVSGASNTSYVNGFITKTGNSPFTFPVGNGGFYQPIAISAPSSATDAFSAKYIFASANSLYPLTQTAATLDHVSGGEYWYLNRTNGSSNVSVTLNWNTNSGGVGNLATMRVARWDVASSKWQDQGNGGTTGNNTAGSVISSSAVNTFSTPNSPFTLGTTDNANTLPIELTNFSCSLIAPGKVKLTWKTASELNNDYFTLDRSANGIDFTSIGKVSGAGTSSSAHNYSFMDNNPPGGISYYRLSQTDFDGNQVSFEVCTVDNDSVLPSVNIYPNPARASVTIEYQNIGKVSQMRILNSMGVEIPVPYSMSEAKIQVNTSSLSSGLFIVELNSEAGLLKSKLIITN